VPAIVDPVSGWENPRIVSTANSIVRREDFITRVGA
jgi:hypothetical protein